MINKIQPTNILTQNLSGIFRKMFRESLAEMGPWNAFSLQIESLTKNNEWKSPESH